MTLGVAEMLRLKRLLEDIKVNNGAKMKLWCNSKLAISITSNPVQYDRTKHVEIDRLFIRKKLKSVLLELNHVTIENQVVNYFIKGFSSINLIRLCNNMNLIDIFYLRESIEI
jgi:hypothetical protein